MDAKNKLKKAKQFAMLQAIQRDEEPAVTLNLEDQVVEDSYKGPKFDDIIDLEFCSKLGDWMKDEKKLHTRYLIMMLNKAINFLDLNRSIVQDIHVKEANKITVCGDTHGQQ